MRIPESDENQFKEEETGFERSPVRRRSRFSRSLYSSKVNLSKRQLFFIILMLVMLYGLFLGWMAWMFTQEPINNQQKTKVKAQQVPEIPNEAPIIEIENPKELIDKFIQLNNVNKEPIGLFFARYLLTSSEFSSQKINQKHKNEINYYQKIYGKQYGRKIEELPICVVAAGRNNMAKGRQKRFLESLQDQNYQNYQLAYVDDASEDGTAQFTTNYIKKSKILESKAVIEAQSSRHYVLANKIKAIDDYCKEDSIIIDVDADDRFIGREVLRVINFLYSRHNETWLLYTNHLIATKGQIQLGKNRGLSDAEFQSYRTSELWVTSHLKTYRRQLFMKIERGQWKMDTGEYLHWASDRLILYPLLELAGSQHTKFENVILYLYDYEAAGDVRNFQVIKPDKLKSQLLVPYEPLGSLSDEPKKRINYEPPAILKEYYRRAQQKYAQLMRRNSAGD